MAVDRTLGVRPFHPLMRSVLSTLVCPRSDDDEIIVHHYIDTPHLLQLEVELRSPTLGIAFERVKYFY